MFLICERGERKGIPPGLVEIHCWRGDRGRTCTEPNPARAAAPSRFQVLSPSSLQHARTPWPATYCLRQAKRPCACGRAAAGRLQPLLPKPECPRFRRSRMWCRPRPPGPPPRGTHRPPTRRGACRLQRERRSGRGEGRGAPAGWPGAAGHERETSSRRPLPNPGPASMPRRVGRQKSADPRGADAPSKRNRERLPGEGEGVGADAAPSRAGVARPSARSLGCRMRSRTLLAASAPCASAAAQGKRRSQAPRGLTPLVVQVVLAAGKRELAWVDEGQTTPPQCRVLGTLVEHHGLVCDGTPEPGTRHGAPMTGNTLRRAHASRANRADRAALGWRACCSAGHAPPPFAHAPSRRATPPRLGGL